MRLDNTKGLIVVVVAYTAVVAWAIGTYWIAQKLTSNPVGQLATWIAIGGVLPGIVATLWFDYKDMREDEG